MRGCKFNHDFVRNEIICNFRSLGLRTYYGYIIYTIMFILGFMSATNNLKTQLVQFRRHGQVRLHAL